MQTLSYGCRIDTSDKKIKITDQIKSDKAVSAGSSQALTYSFLFFHCTFVCHRLDF